MKQFSYVLTKPHAMYAKPISVLMREAARFSSSVHLAHENKAVLLKDAKMLLGANVGCGSMLTVTVEGKDEEAAVAAIQDYFVANM